MKVKDKVHGKIMIKIKFKITDRKKIPNGHKKTSEETQKDKKTDSLEHHEPRAEEGSAKEWLPRCT